MKNKKVYFALLALIVSSSSCARLARIPGDRFFACINRPPIAVVLFYCNTNRSTNDTFRFLHKRMEAVSNNKTYQYAQLFFGTCNLATDQCLAKHPDLGLMNMQKPVVMLFQRGQPLGPARNPITLAGCFTEGDLARFIDNNLGETINQIGKQKSEYEKELLASGCGYGYGCGLRPVYCWPGGYYGGCGFGYRFGWGYGCGPWTW